MSDGGSHCCQVCSLIWNDWRLISLCWLSASCYNGNLMWNLMTEEMFWVRGWCVELCKMILSAIFLKSGPYKMSIKSQYYPLIIRRVKCGIFVLATSKERQKRVAVQVFLWSSPWSCLGPRTFTVAFCGSIMHTEVRPMHQIKCGFLKRHLGRKCRGKKYCNWFSKSRNTEAAPLAENLHLNQSRVHGKREIH